MSPAPVPDLAVESALLRSGARFVVGCDEVGRGALAGPVAVGAVLVDAGVGEFPAGLRDSKLLSAVARERIAPACRSWALAWAVGEATPAEVDAHGIVVALGLAGQRALAALGTLPSGVALLLDGSHDWLSPALPAPLPLTTRIKADQACASVAAASVIAKVHRDGLMTGLHEEWPHYGWAQNKGYGSSAHLGAIAEHGPSPHHRLSWLRPAA